MYQNNHLNNQRRKRASNTRRINNSSNPKGIKVPTRTKVRVPRLRDKKDPPAFRLKSTTGNLFTNNSRDRVMRVPAAEADLMETSSPQILNLSTKETIVRHREYFAEVTSNTDFTVVRYPLNPGVELVFPWGSGVANQYEKYHIEKMTIMYRARCATFETGGVFISIDYDPSDGIPADKNEMLAAESVDGAPWMSFVMQFDTRLLHSTSEWLYVRSESAFTDIDSQLNLYDCAQIFVAVEGNSAADLTLGELWIEYEIRYLNPQLNTIITTAYQHESNTIANNANPVYSGAAKNEQKDNLDVTILPILGTADRVTLNKYGYFYGIVVATGSILAMTAVQHITLGNLGHIVTNQETIVYGSTFQTVRFFLLQVVGRVINVDYLHLSCAAYANPIVNYVVTLLPASPVVQNVLTLHPKKKKKKKEKAIIVSAVCDSSSEESTA
jgi:hypothetical protein